MQDITDFCTQRKKQYEERAENLREQEKAIKRAISANEKAYGEIPGHQKAIIPDEHGRKQLQSVISKQNELLAKAEFIEELQEMYF